MNNEDLQSFVQFGLNLEKLSDIFPCSCQRNVVSNSMLGFIDENIGSSQKALSLLPTDHVQVFRTNHLISYNLSYENLNPNYSFEDFI